MSSDPELRTNFALIWLDSYVAPIDERETERFLLIAFENVRIIGVEDQTATMFLPSSRAFGISTR